MTPETIQFIVGLLLTIVVLSYLIGDNFLYRLAIHILVGVGAAYVVGVAVGQVLFLRLVMPVTSDAPDGRLFGGLGILGSVFLFFKLFSRVAWLGNVAVGYMIGVGAGVAIGGALFGTLVPQALASAQSNVLAVVSTLAVLTTFTYSRAVWRTPVGWIGTLGRGVLYVAFGATFALVFIAGASVLVTWASDVAVRFQVR